MSDLNTSLLTLNLIRDEREVLVAYPDSLSYLTIGVGHCIDKRVGGGITRDISRYILTDDIEGVTQQLDHSIPWWRQLSEVRQRVLANMCFNLGIGKLLKFQATLDALRRGDDATAARQMMQSLWAKQVGERAKRLQYMVLNNRDPT